MRNIDAPGLGAPSLLEHDWWQWRLDTVDWSGHPTGPRRVETVEAVECTGTVGGSGVYWHCWRQWSVLVLLEAVECTGTVGGMDPPVSLPRLVSL